MPASDSLSVSALLTRLERFYGPLPAPPLDPFRAFVWEVLSTQTTPGRRDAAYAALLRIPALTPDSMFRAPRARLMQAIARAGAYQEQRLEALLAGVHQFRRRPDLASAIGGPLRPARRALRRLPRLGEASAHRILLFGGGHCVLPIDRATARMCGRLGLASAPLAPRVRRAVSGSLVQDRAAYQRAALYLGHHAVQTCTDEPHCGVCPLSDVCPSSRSAVS